MRILCSLAMAMVCGLAVHASAQVTFLDDFDDGMASTRWSAPIVDSELGAFDGEVDYAFDYGAIGIPSSPNSAGTSTGILMEVNLTDDGPIDEGESVAIIPLSDILPAGSFSLTMDVFFNYETQSSGTTEYGTFGIHTAAVNAPGDAGLNDDVPFRFGLSNGNGLAWQATGDAGAADDFFRYEDAGNTDAGSQIALGAYDDIPGGAIPGVSTGQGAAGPGGGWVEIEITRNGKILSFSMNGYEIDSIIDRNDDFVGGSIMIGYSDPFNSAGTPDLPVGPDPDPFDDIPYGDAYPNLAHFIIFDNVQVASIVPEPSSIALTAIGLFGLVAVVRRHK